MGQKWSKAQHKKYSATMKKRREESKKSPKFDVLTSMTLADLREDDVQPTAAWPNGTLPLLKKWNLEADEAFRVLPLEQKAVLLAQVKP